MASADWGPQTLAPWPDQLAVQFPPKIPEGMERPYFLMGSNSGAVYQWRWSSAPRRAVAGLARGIERFDTLPPAGGPAAQAVWDPGQWRGVFTPAPATAATGPGRRVPPGRGHP